MGDINGLISVFEDKQVGQSGATQGPAQQVPQQRGMGPAIYAANPYMPDASNSAAAAAYAPIVEEGVHFSGMLDLNGLWRVYNEKFRSYTYFSLHHQAKALLGIKQEAPHNAATDAILSIRLFRLFQLVQDKPEEMDRARKALLTSEMEPSFAKLNPAYDGVCMGNKKTCTCGSPFFF